jgi:hypothetical protein
METTPRALIVMLKVLQYVWKVTWCQSAPTPLPGDCGINIDVRDNKLYSLAAKAENFVAFMLPAGNHGSNSKGLLLWEAFVVSNVTPSKRKWNVLLYCKYLVRCTTMGYNAQKLFQLVTRSLTLSSHYGVLKLRRCERACKRQRTLITSAPGRTQLQNKAL